jgi:FixJ family two-component response regulator
MLRPGRPDASGVAATPVVYIVDDDISVREALETLIAHEGWRPLAFASAQAFLAHPRSAAPGCLVLDVGLPDLNGLELQKRLAGGNDLPIIFITGFGDIPMTVQAMKAGAVEFLTKPFPSDVLIGAIRSALEQSRSSRAEEASLQALRTRHAALSRRQQHVLALVVHGRLNKQAAASLGISEITVKGHRGRMMRKMRAKSFAELVKMADRLGLATAGKR